MNCLDHLGTNQQVSWQLSVILLEIMFTDNQSTHIDQLVVYTLVDVDLQSGPKKRGNKIMTIILSNLNRFKNFFHWKIPWYICS